jgi:hypothetical protein
MVLVRSRNFGDFQGGIPIREMGFSHGDDSNTDDNTRDKKRS